MVLLSGFVLPAVIAGPVRIEQRTNGWWWVGPDSQPFFSVGACVVGSWDRKEQHDPENPGYSVWKNHPSPEQWADVTVRRLRSWGFTTLGGWSDHTILRQSKEPPLWHTPVLHIGSAAGAPWWDLWDPAVVQRMESRGKEEIAVHRANPQVLGYYTDNELGWWSASLWKHTLEQKPTSGQRQRLVQLLRSRYAGNWDKLSEDFEQENADGWQALEAGGALYVKPGGEGFVVLRQFLGLVASRYYQLVHDIVRSHHPDALILGDRYASFYYPEVARAAAPWVDAISSNLNADWNDGSFLRCYLDTLHQITGKPIVVTEIYGAANSNRTGNRNTHGIYPVVERQSQRAALARRTLDLLARTPSVIGADWFQYADEPVHGRGDGENFNFGLVDIHDRPYAELAAAFAGFNPWKIRASGTHQRLDARSGLPPAPGDPFASFSATLALKHWDRERGFIPSSTSEPVADLYGCWNRRSLYLGLCALDVTESAFYRWSYVPKEDRAQWIIEMDGQEIVRTRVGSGKEPIQNNPRVRVEQITGPSPVVRTTVALAIPAEELGRKRLQPGDTLRLKVSYASHGRVQRVAWEGTFPLAR
jgi:hypothetical protein